MLLLAEQPVEQVTATLGCGRASVYVWAADCRAHGRAASARRCSARRPALLEQRLTADPQAHGQHATGWTVPLLPAALAAAGHVVSERTSRRTWHRRGWRWQRPKYVLGRPDPAYADKKTA